MATKIQYTQEVDMSRHDETLCRVVFSEARGRYIISAYISRYGNLSVFVDMCKDCLWQGDNILDARDWIEGQQDRAPQHDQHVRDAIRDGRIGDF